MPTSTRAKRAQTPKKKQEAASPIKKKQSSSFETPNRQVDAKVVAAPKAAASAKAAAAKTVTPPDTTETKGGGGKQVRFNGDDNATSATSSPGGGSKGLVSRRGGRFGSPGGGNKTEPVLEYKTYRSPTTTLNKQLETVPSLCSSSGSGLHGEQKEAAAKDDAPKSISCDTSQVDTTSPLTSHDPLQPGAAKREKDVKKEATPVRKPAAAATPSSDPSDKKKVPTRSSPDTGFQSLPTLKDAKLSSPEGTFLSPHSPNPSALTAKASFDKNEDAAAKKKETTPKQRDADRARAVATPTDFALDFGKEHKTSPSFDASNVLAWLQSPTANGMFSPGGFSSIVNTPRQGGMPRTPRTPTVSTSFFFSDVASLPGGELARDGDGGGAAAKRSGGMSSQICISPLASKRRSSRDPSRTNTPSINYKDVFASPKHGDEKPLGDTPAGRTRTTRGKSAAADGSLDAVSMAERDLMEDEDLSVLLQLASQTPRNRDGSDVFRSPRSRAKRKDASLPGLQLPIIGNGEAGARKLSIKSQSRNPSDTNDFVPPPLGIRSSSSVKTDKIKGKAGDKGKAETEKGKKKDGKAGDKKRSRKMAGVPSHATYPHYPPEGAYYHMPAHMSMPPGGSMRVVVGGPPPVNRGTKKTSSSSSPPRGPPYPMNPDGSYAPPMYHPHYPPPPHVPLGVPPHYAHHYGMPPPRHMPIYAAQQHAPSSKNTKKRTSTAAAKSKTASSATTGKRPAAGLVISDSKLPPASLSKKSKKSPKQTKTKKRSPTLTDPADRKKAAANIESLNAASGGKNDKAAALAAAILRGVTMRPSGKWQAQLYYAGKSRYIGVFDTREKAALAYEIARERLKSDARTDHSAQSLKATEAAVNAARKAAFEGVKGSDSSKTK